MGQPIYTDSDADLLSAKIEEYFNLCEIQGKTPLQIGLAVHLGISKNTIVNYKYHRQKAPKISELFRSANDRLELRMTDRLLDSDRPVREIFLLKANHGLIETSNVNHGGQSQNPIQIVSFKDLRDSL